MRGVLAAASLASVLLNANAADFPAVPPRDVSRAMDRDQMLAQLGIQIPNLPSKTRDPNRPPRARPADPKHPDGNWTDDAGHLYTRSEFGLWNNYDDLSGGFMPGAESWRVGTYTPLPLLVTYGGATVRSAEQWWSERRPELLREVQQELWGVPPSQTPSVNFTVRRGEGGTGALAYHDRALMGEIDVSSFPELSHVPRLNAWLRLPAAAPEPVPVIIVFYPFARSPRATVQGFMERYWEKIGPRGWGVCIFDPSTLQPDDGQDLTSYLIGFCNRGQWRRPADWGALAAWSWGVSRLIDYFETDPKIDARKIGVSGHSRYGKAALAAMVYDPRLLIAFPSCAGSLGTKLMRRHWGQDLENSAWDQEYHWAAGNFFKYMGPLKRGQYLPRRIEMLRVDAHSLIALCAPRPLFITGGTEDPWSDPYGEYLAAREASSVYELLGYAGLVVTDPQPRPDVAYTSGRIGYRYHVGGHTDEPDWPAFLDFAGPYFAGTSPAGARH